MKRHDIYYFPTFCYLQVERRRAVGVVGQDGGAVAVTTGLELEPGLELDPATTRLLHVGAVPVLDLPPIQTTVTVNAVSKPNKNGEYLSLKVSRF